MKKQNGFIFMETIVVVSVLSITLLLLFTSYSYILRKARERNVFDTSDTIYKLHYIEHILVNNSSRSSIVDFITNENVCSKIAIAGAVNEYECDLTGTFNGNTIESNTIESLKNSFGLQKIFYIKPSEVYNNDTLLLHFDATTIDYIRKLGKNDNMHRIYKFKKCYNDSCSDYEIFHASVEEVPQP